MVSYITVRCYSYMTGQTVDSYMTGQTVDSYMTGQTVDSYMTVRLWIVI
jgi:hypothetical protein